MFRKGDEVIVKQAIVHRPIYFNPDGLMDKYLGGKVSARVDGFGTMRIDDAYWPCVKIRDDENATTWLIIEVDVQLKALDNRRIEYV